MQTHLDSLTQEIIEGPHISITLQVHSESGDYERIGTFFHFQDGETCGKFVQEQLQRFIQRDAGGVKTAY